MQRIHHCSLTALVLCGACLARASAADVPTSKSIDVVICLDVSGSMNGLIDSAKARLWDIVNDLAKIKPTPNLRVGLYTYGHSSYDPKAGWVRKEVDLTHDLDVINQKLFALTINGGTEYVGRVCRDALTQQKWADDRNALKVIFVCGNEPASQDPEAKLRAVGELAGQKGIVINPIYCGNPESRDAQDWKEFAGMAGGKFASINQDRGTVAIATPQDKELNDLGAKLNSTYVIYGKAGKERQLNQVVQDANAARLGAAPAAARAQSKGSALYRNEEWDLVDRLKSDPKFDLKKVPVEELSEELKKMTPEQRESHVKEMLARREAIQKQITEVSQKRDAYLREEARKNATKEGKALDEALRGTLREQAATKGIKIPD